MQAREGAQRRWARRLVALGLGLALAPLLAEAGYRAFRLGALSPTTNPAYVEHDGRLGWRYAPDSAQRHASAEFDVEVRINAQGFRGPDWPAGAKRRPRVLVLGDSYAFGWGVAHEDSLVGVLQRTAPEWDLLGAGVSGYGTDQECLLLEQLLPRWEPDVAVVVFCDNDLFECASDTAYGKRKPRFVRADGALRLEGVPVPQPWLERASLAWRALLKSRWERELARRERDPNAEWALVCDLYRRMKADLGPRPLVIVSGSDRLARLAAEEPGFVHVDLRGAFAGASEPLTFARDGHWTPAGHARAAAALLRALRPRLP